MQCHCSAPTDQKQSSQRVHDMCLLSGALALSRLAWHHVRLVAGRHVSSSSAPLFFKDASGQLAFACMLKALQQDGSLHTLPYADWPPRKVNETRRKLPSRVTTLPSRRGTRRLALTGSPLPNAMCCQETYNCHQLPLRIDWRIAWLKSWRLCPSRTKRLLGSRSTLTQS